MSAYPTGYDAFTNPAGSDPLNTAGAKLHSTQHGQVNDAIEAIEAELGLSPSGSEATVAARLTAIEASIGGGGGGGGLVLVDTGTVSAASTLTAGPFDGTYDDYRLILRLTASADVILKAQLRVAGTAATSAYECTRAYWGAASGTDNNQQGTDEWMISTASNAFPSLIILDIASPAIAEPTIMTGTARSYYSGRYAMSLFGDHSTATAYDDLRVTPDSGTLTGRWALYGYAK